MTDSKTSPETYTVLIIEDDVEVAKLMELGLQHEGIACRKATDGAVGLKSFKDEPPHLVLLDIMMPGMSGREVLTEIRLISQVPVLIVSALASDEEWPEANGFIAKPFSPLRLSKLVRSTLKDVYES